MEQKRTYTTACLAVLLIMLPSLATARPIEALVPDDTLGPMAAKTTVIASERQTSSIRWLGSDDATLLVLPGVAKAAENHGLDIVLRDLPWRNATHVALLVNGSQVDLVPYTGGAVFESAPVSDSLLYTFVVYADDGYLLDELSSVQALVNETSRSGTGGVPSILNVQVVEGGEEPVNLVENVGIPAADPVPMNQGSGGGGGGSYSRGSSGGSVERKHSANCPTDNGMSKQPSSAVYGRYSGASQSPVVLAAATWKGTYDYYTIHHDCTKSNSGQATFGFGYGWTGPNSFSRDWYESFQWAVSAEGDTDMKYYSGKYYGHEITVLNSKVFFYDIDELPDSYHYYTTEDGRAHQSCWDDPLPEPVKWALGQIKDYGSVFGVLDAMIPDRSCTTNWSEITSSWQGSGMGVKSSVNADSKDNSQQKMPKGILTSYIAGEPSVFTMELEGASDVRAWTRAGTCCDWQYSRAWEYIVIPVNGYMQDID